MKILVVEDDAKMADLLRRGLAAEGHSADIAGDGISGLHKAQTLSYEAVVLDIMLPGLDGVGVVRRLRSAGVHVPILMLTARDSPRDIVRGSGADDYLSKPFSFEVLTARLRAIARRTGAEASAAQLRVADLVMDTSAHEVHRGGRAVPLTRTEFQLLECLTRRAGRVVSRNDLIESVWGMDREVESNTLDVFIFQLRNKLEAGGGTRLIQTVRGFGYSMREAEE